MYDPLLFGDMVDRQLVADRQVDYIMSPLSIVSRMTSDAFLSLWCNSVLVDLKKRVVDIYNKE